MIIPAGAEEQVLHICRQRGINRNECIRNRMGELDAERMERLTLYIGPAATVQIIAAQWMAQTGTVYPDLMGASRVKGKLQQTVAVCRSETLDVRMRRFAVSIGTAQDDAVRGAGNGPVYS